MKTSKTKKELIIEGLELTYKKLIEFKKQKTLDLTFTI